MLRLTRAPTISCLSLTRARQVEALACAQSDEPHDSQLNSALEVAAPQ